MKASLWIVLAGSILLLTGTVLLRLTGEGFNDNLSFWMTVVIAVSNLINSSYGLLNKKKKLSNKE